MVYLLINAETEDMIGNFTSDKPQGPGIPLRYGEKDYTIIRMEWEWPLWRLTVKELE